MKYYNILSLFDGISCGHLALERANIQIDNYYASEINKYAISITQKNYPNTIQLGDITKWKEWNINWNSIDILFAGFPCQAWSIAGKQKGVDDPRGQLAIVLCDIFKFLKEKNPNLIFLFENVKMKKEYVEYLNDLFDCKPIEINSALVSAQNRKRLYWTNIQGITQPNDKVILLKDIIHENCDLCWEYRNDTKTKRYIPNNKYHNDKNKINIIGNTKTREKAIGQRDIVYSKEGKIGSLTATDYKDPKLTFEILNEYIIPFDKTLKILEKEVEKGKIGYFRKDSQANRVYFIHDKAITLCGDAGGGAAKMGQYLFGCITPDRVNKRQNGQRFNNGTKFYTLTAQDKHGILIEGYIRKLTPVECERLQTLPDNYTESISKTQRYKCLGNGWTVDIISHILSFIKERSNGN